MGAYPEDTGWLGRWRERVRPYYLRHIYFRLRPGTKPAEFERCWQSPVEWLGQPRSLDIPPPQAGRADVVILPMTDWRHRMQRSQYLALELAALGRRCFLLNPHLGREYPESPSRPRRIAVARLGQRAFELHVPMPREPVFHHRLLSREESALLAGGLAAALERAGSREVAVVFALPTWTGAAELLRKQCGARLFYDCHDWIAGFSNMAREVANAVPTAMRAADVVLFSASRLQEEYGRLVPETRHMGVLLRNGAPQWPEAEAPRPRELVAGYVGAIEDWFWIEGVEAAARRLPTARFVLAGRAAKEVKRRLGRRANIEFTGEVPAAEVPRLLSRFRTGLLPRRGELAEYMDPLKLYEYFHFGLPVAASALPEVVRHADLVYAAKSPEDFAAAVEAALAEDDPRREMRRKQIAQESTWRKRAEALDRILDRADTV